MVSNEDDEYWGHLKKEVEDYRDGKIKIEHFAEKRNDDDWLYQQKMAESRRNYYPIRIGQVGFIVALLSSIIILIFKDVAILVLKYDERIIKLTDIQIILFLIIVILSIALYCSQFYLIKRFSNLQDLIEKIERKKLELNENKIKSKT